MPSHRRLRDTLFRKGPKGLVCDEQVLQYVRPGRGDECELVVGLDFGTSASKVVIQAPDLPGSPSFAVDFGDLAHETTMPYLLPSRLWINEETFSLRPSEHARPIYDVKLGLLQRSEAREGNERVPSYGEISPEAEATAYLALVLRFSRRWFLTTKGDIVRHFSRLIWSVNMGVPSPCIEDNEENRVFRRVGRAAWMLSTLPEDRITPAQVVAELKRIDEPGYWETDDELTCDFEIIPEIAAGAVGYALSDLRREGLHVMVDIGASTVDACSFLLNAHDDSDRYSLLITDVQHIGALQIHHERLDAMNQAVHQHTRDLQNRLDRLAPVPEEHDQYLISRRKLADAVLAADRSMVEKISYMMRRVIWQTKLRRHPRAPVWRKGKVPVLVIGGASQMRVFRSAIEELDGWLKKNTRNDGITNPPVPVPTSLARSAIKVDEQRRLAVAWGLSHRSLDIGEIIPADRIPDAEPPRERDWRNRYVGKDVV